MNGKIWEDDTQIISLYVTKQWAEKDSEGYFILSVSN
jgi:Holliday junction resolvase RusA-like endonuclease